MIVTVQKSREKIQTMISPYQKLIILGCSDCAAACLTGGSQQVEEMKDFLKDKTILATISLDSPCDKRLASRDMKLLEEELQQTDALLALCCGSGVQSLSEVLSIPVIGALDTLFLGMIERLGQYYERCSQCGDCMLSDRAGICPVSLCPKNLRNGPCEDCSQGQCLLMPDASLCVWEIIASALQKSGEPDKWHKMSESVDYSKFPSPKQLIAVRK